MLGDEQQLLSVGLLRLQEKRHRVMGFLSQNSIHGSPHKHSSVGRGIRQNDPVYSALILSAWRRRGMAASEELPSSALHPPPV